MKEVWKDIAGYEGLYQVSNLGRTKSISRARTKGGIMLQHFDKKGYKVVVLSKGGKLKACKVHRLVAEAFIANPDNKPQINHIDENKTNNYVHNLEWCDNQHNARHGTKSKRAYETRQEAGKPINAQIKVVQYSMEGDFLKEYESATSAANELGLDQSSITKCCRHKRKTAGGFIWKYK